MCKLAHVIRYTVLS